MQSREKKGAPCPHPSIGAWSRVAVVISLSIGNSASVFTIHVEPIEGTARGRKQLDSTKQSTGPLSNSCYHFPALFPAVATSIDRTIAALHGLMRLYVMAALCCCSPRATKNKQVPHPYTIGSLLRFTKEASYWAFSVVGNWAERYRVFALEDVVAQQLALEDPLFKAQVVLVFSISFFRSCSPSKSRKRS